MRISRSAATQARFCSGGSRAIQHHPDGENGTESASLAGSVAGSGCEGMLARLATVIDRRPWRFLLVAAACVAASAPLGLQVRDQLKPRGFDVPGSDSAKARAFIAEASGTDPANTVLALVHLPGRYGQPEARRTIATVERTLQQDPAVVRVLDAESAH